MRVVLVLGLLLVTATAVAWAAKIDIVAPTRGEVVARERTRGVQALEAGVVAALHVDEGSRVRRGELLVELDDTIVGSEIRRIEAALLEALRTTRRLRLVESGPRVGEPGDALSGGLPEPPAFGTRTVAGQGWETHLRLADLERRRLAADLDEAERRVETARSRLAGIAAERRLVDRLMPVVREQVDGLAALAARSHASRHDYLRELSRQLELEGRAESLALDRRR